MSNAARVSRIAKLTERGYSFADAVFIETKCASGRALISAVEGASRLPGYRGPSIPDARRAALSQVEEALEVVRRREPDLAAGVEKLVAVARERIAA